MKSDDDPQSPTPGRDRRERERERQAQEPALGESSNASLALARTAAETIRALNHATLGGSGLDQPADAYQLLGELSLAASRLPQLLTQVGRWLDGALAAGQLGCDDRTDPAIAVSGAQTHMTAARNTAAALARDLDYAQQQIAAVHGSPSLIADALARHPEHPTGNPIE